MAAGFSIIIKATDSATARIDALNKKLAAARAPVDRLNKSLQTLARLSGVSRVAENFGRMGRGAYAAFQSVARIVAPLSAIAGAASVAGMYRLVEAWGQWGSQLGFVAQRIGLTATQMQIFQGAGLLAGTNVQAMTGGLQALGQAMYEAIGGRAPETVALFNQLGVAFDNGTRHGRNVSDVLLEVADKIKGIKDPFTQARIATQLFGAAGEALLPTLRLGRKGIEDLEAAARRYGVMNQAGIDAANRMRVAQGALQLAVAGLTNSIAEHLAPVLAPLLTQMADWIALNRNWISSGITDAVKSLSDYLKTIDFKGILDDLRGIAKTTNEVVTAFGGWKTVLEGLIAIKATTFLFGVLGGVNALSIALASLTLAYGVNAIAYQDWLDRTDQQGAINSERELQRRRAAMSPHERAKYDALRARHGGTGVMGSPLDQQRRGAGLPTSIGVGAGSSGALAYFKAQGWSAAQAAGIVANLQAESGLNPNAIGDGGEARGAGQWHVKRQALFAALTGHSIVGSSLADQLRFTQWELTHSESAAGDRLRGAQTPDQAGAIVSQFYERPLAVHEAARNRGALAERLAAADGKSGATGRVDVHLQVSGGQVEKTTARATGNVNPPKVASSGVGLAHAT